MLSLVVVPFEPALGEDLAAQRKQADKARRAQALSEAQAMLCAAGDVVCIPMEIG